MWVFDYCGASLNIKIVKANLPNYISLSQNITSQASMPTEALSCSGSRFDRGLGGFEMDLRLRDHLAKLFNEQKKSQKDVRENHRAMAKLLKEAQRLKTVLSANAEFLAQVRRVM